MTDLRRESLFQRGEFTLASGQKSAWKLECDVLTEADWEGVAAIMAERLPLFSKVIGVPRGGWPLAKALEPYASTEPNRLLMVDDVWTTGGSIRRFRDWHQMVDEDREIVGAVLFARNQPDAWVTPLFVMPPPPATPTEENEE